MKGSHMANLNNLKRAKALGGYGTMAKSKPKAQAVAKAVKAMPKGAY